MQFHLEFTKEIVTKLIEDEGEPTPSMFTQSTKDMLKDESFEASHALLAELCHHFFNR